MTAQHEAPRARRQRPPRRLPGAVPHPRAIDTVSVRGRAATAPGSRVDRADVSPQPHDGPQPTTPANPANPATKKTGTGPTPIARTRTGPNPLARHWTPGPRPRGRPAGECVTGRARPPSRSTSCRPRGWSCRASSPRFPAHAPVARDRCERRDRDARRVRAVGLRDDRRQGVGLGHARGGCCSRQPHDHGRADPGRVASGRSGGSEIEMTPDEPAARPIAHKEAPNALAQAQPPGPTRCTPENLCTRTSSPPHPRSPRSPTSSSRRSTKQVRREYDG